MGLVIRKLSSTDLPEADRIFRLAFGTHFRLADPMTAFDDADYVFTRWTANPENAFAAELDGRLVGSNFTTRWGSVAFFGPLTITPAAWGQGIGKGLINEALRQFDSWNVSHRGLFTFSESPKHISLYRGFGFWPRFLTGIMNRPLSVADSNPEYLLWSGLDPHQQQYFLAECEALSNAIYPGLSVSCEIHSVADQALGDTVLLVRGEQINGFAVCHCGRRTEAGRDRCYIKFAAVRPSPSSGAVFVQLLAACEHYALSKGCQQVVCGVNYGRSKAVNELIRRGYKTELLGVTMHSGNAPGYSLPDSWIIDDWR